MIFPRDLATMQPEAKTALFQQVAAQHYGTTVRLDSHIMRDFGVGRRTYFDWLAQDNVPNPVILCLSAWVELAKTIDRLAARDGKAA